MLSGAGFRDYAGLAHPAGQQDLAHAVIGFMTAGVVKLVALEVHLGAAKAIGQTFSEP